MAGALECSGARFKSAVDVRRSPRTMPEPIVLLQILWTGTVTSLSLVLLTIAFSLTQKVTGLWNFAQAGFMGLARNV